ncbi:L,D-transpeptidase [Polyangium jinanense]|uniref:L,D-transpeptidase n=1 Tax=Polyangium jinanense TaxID=2829994 RepID=A0A9X4B0E6_9BACT|nr:L,D-transpeptidase [Polyangium jinanense]MDC3962640.1 L,D-transpeptidase [Polyangium jinanense]MDC3989077.1 L,D-transpeptidase [Polyangium jinanense]
MTRTVLSLLCALAAGCGGPKAEAVPDAGAEAGADADAAADAAADADAAAVAAAAAAADTDTEPPRLGSIGVATVIYQDRSRKRRIGDVRPGTSVILQSDEPVEVPPSQLGGCKSGRFYPVAPRGFICEDETITRNLDDPRFRALALAAPREGPRPYDYAFSTRAPMYGQIPTSSEQARTERRLRPVADLARVRRSMDGHEDLAELTPTPARDPIPEFLLGEKEAPVPAGRRGGLVRKEIPHGSMLSFSHAFAVEGRTFLLSPDLALVPADRMRPFRPSVFHGVAIGSTNSLPIGWFRKTARTKYKREESGAFAATGETWAPRTFVRLSGKSITHDGDLFWETREPGPTYARARDISVVAEPDEWPRMVGADEKWIDVSLSRGTMTLFEGRRAVYSTLMSPGAGGVTASPKATTEELVRGAFTPLGSYRIAVKYRAAQLTDEATPDPSAFWIADVPWVQYFRNPFAIHAAYWHEDFGSPKSGGCINLSPEDASIVFAWTDPPVPEGWSSADARPSEPGTWIVIRK